MASRTNSPDASRPSSRGGDDDDEVTFDDLIQRVRTEAATSNRLRKKEIDKLATQLSKFHGAQLECNAGLTEDVGRLERQNRELTARLDSLQQLCEEMQTHVKLLDKRCDDAAARAANSRAASQQATAASDAATQRRRTAQLAVETEVAATWPVNHRNGSVLSGLATYLGEAQRNKTEQVRNAIKGVHDFVVAEYKQRNKTIADAGPNVTNELRDSCDNRLQNCLNLFISIAEEMSEQSETLKDEPSSQFFLVTMRQMRDFTTVTDPAKADRRAIFDALKARAQEETKVRAAELRIAEAARSPARAPGKKAQAPAPKPAAPNQGNGRGQGL